MTMLGRDVTTAAMHQVEVVYLNRETSSWWNANRAADDTRMFCGWYWLKGNEEAGPFRTRSAALRDAYYRYVLHRAPPTVAHDAWRRPVPGARRPVKLRTAAKGATS